MQFSSPPERSGGMKERGGGVRWDNGVMG